ncbi:MAG: desulfoferrodoxin [Candidatus Nanoarchaeia archaeon]|nr:desulfoferrodoxin [Candidatus Nanoarchaeia archaeon]
MKEGNIYKCEVCGNTISLLVVGGGDLVCCGQEMLLMEEKTQEKEGKEKHVPVIEIDGNTVKVKVGSVSHPMEENHYISLIQLLKDGDVVAGKRLYPGDEPVAEFELTQTTGVSARILCNIHGVWISN